MEASRTSIRYTDLLDKPVGQHAAFDRSVPSVSHTSTIGLGNQTTIRLSFFSSSFRMVEYAAARYRPVQVLIVAGVLVVCFLETTWHPGIHAADATVHRHPQPTGAAALVHAGRKPVTLPDEPPQSPNDPAVLKWRDHFWPKLQCPHNASVVFYKTHKTGSFHNGLVHLFGWVRSNGFFSNFFAGYVSLLLHFIYTC
jgi:hypothetical protein